MVFARKDEIFMGYVSFREGTAVYRGSWHIWFPSLVSLLRFLGFSVSRFNCNFFGWFLADTPRPQHSCNCSFFFWNIQITSKYCCWWFRNLALAAGETYKAWLQKWTILTIFINWPMNCEPAIIVSLHKFWSYNKNRLKVFDIQSILGWFRFFTILRWMTGKCSTLVKVSPPRADIEMTWSDKHVVHRPNWKRSRGVLKHIHLLIKYVDIDRCEV